MEEQGLPAQAGVRGQELQRIGQRQKEVMPPVEAGRHVQVLACESEKPPVAAGELASPRMRRGELFLAWLGRVSPV